MIIKINEHKKGRFFMKKTKITKSIVRFFVAAICIVTAFTTSAFAGYSNSDFNVDSPKLGRSGYTGTQTKATTNRSGHIHFDYVGADYKVDCRLRDKGDKTEGAWVKDCTDGTDKNLASRASHASGDKMCVRIDNKLTTPVDVNSYGNWRSDV